MSTDGRTIAVTAAIVTYNSAGVIGDCLASLDEAFGDIPYEVVVVDNSSTDGSLAAVRAARPDAVTLPLAGNLGYAAGVNAAVAASRAAEAILVLNPDIRLAARSVPPLLDALRRPGTAIAVPRMVSADGELLYSLRREPAISRTLGEAVLGGGRASRSRWTGEVVGCAAAYSQATTADWASGAAMLISRAAFAAIGPWNESYFLYSEETDFALRAKDSGYVTRYVPQSVAVHLGGEMAVDPRLWSIAVVNKIRLYRARHRLIRSVAFQAAVVLNEGLRAARGRRVNRAGLRAALLVRSDR